MDFREGLLLISDGSGFTIEKCVECEVLLTEEGEDDAGGNQYFHTTTQRW